MEKLTIDNSIADFISTLKSKWEPKTKQEVGYGYHGSSKGDKIEWTSYYDEFRAEWTDKNRAFQGFVFDHIKKFL